MPFPRLPILLLVLLIAPLARASRMYLPLNDAIDGATVIVSGALDRGELQLDHQGPAVVTLTVERCWRGDFKPGDKVPCIDQHPRSTGSWAFGSGGKGLLFLKPVDPKQERFDVIDTRLIEADDAQHADPDRAARIAYQQERFDAACRVLDVRLVEKPADLIAAWRKILADEKTNGTLLAYAASELPAPLSRPNAELVASAVHRVANQQNAAYHMLMLLRVAKYEFAPEDLRAIIERGAPITSITSFVTGENANAVQEALFKRLSTPTDPDYADSDALDRLTQVAPAFAKLQLKDPQPFELEIPLLRGLRVNASAFGREDYPEAMLRANAALTRQIGKAIRDPSAPFSLEFQLLYIFQPNSFRDDWVAIAPLMKPLLTAPDAPRRQQTAAFLRTLGFTVEREGDRFNLIDAPLRAPLRLSIVAPDRPIKAGAPWTVHYRHTGVAPSTWVARQPNLERWDIKPLSPEAPLGLPSQISTSRGGWNFPSDKPGAFAQVEKDQSVDLTYTFDASHFPAPGRYKLSLKVIHQDDGRGSDVDAWTGALQAEPIEIDVVP